jgi:hypothetical protein
MVIYKNRSNRCLLDNLNIAAQQRGKWWVVGSAWQGAGPGEISSTAGSTSSTSKFSQKLLDLARKQRMNTELRKNIFCILMTAEVCTFEAYGSFFQNQVSVRHRILLTRLKNCCILELKGNRREKFLMLFWIAASKKQTSIPIMRICRKNSVNTTGDLRLVEIGAQIFGVLIFHAFRCPSSAQFGTKSRS